MVWGFRRLTKKYFLMTSKDQTYTIQALHGASFGPIEASQYSIKVSLNVPDGQTEDIVLHTPSSIVEVEDKEGVMTVVCLNSDYDITGRDLLYFLAGTSVPVAAICLLDWLSKD